VTSASLITVLEAAMRKIRVNDKISKPEEKRKIGYVLEKFQYQLHFRSTSVFDRMLKQLMQKTAMTSVSLYDPLRSVAGNKQ